MNYLGVFKEKLLSHALDTPIIMGFFFGNFQHLASILSCQKWNENFLDYNYLTLRSMVKVPRRSLQYTTHRLMVMHPHTKYHWPISKDKNVMARTRKYYLKNNYLTSKVKVHKGHYGMRHTALWSCTHIPNIIDLSRKTKMLWPGQENII